jgi:hypothetical protein
MKQETFGSVTVNEVTKSGKDAPKCNYSDKDINCENRAILYYVTTFNKCTQYRCGIHSHDWQKEEIEYND